MPTYIYLGNLVYLQYVLGYLLPLTNGINHDLRCSYTKLLSCMITLAKHPRLSINWHLIHPMCTFPYQFHHVELSSTSQNSEASLSAGIPALQVHQHVYHLPCAHLMHLFSKHHVQRDQLLNIWAMVIMLYVNVNPLLRPTCSYHTPLKAILSMMCICCW